MGSGGTCSVDGCPSEAKKDGFCWGHYKRKQRGQAIHVELGERAKTRWEGVVKAALNLAQFAEKPASEVADTERAWRRAEYRYRRAIHRYMKSMRKRTPTGPCPPEG